MLQYNGCKWLGGTLRVEPAKPNYKLRLAIHATEDLSCEGVSSPEGFRDRSADI